MKYCFSHNEVGERGREKRERKVLNKRLQIMLSAFCKMAGGKSQIIDNIIHYHSFQMLVRFASALGFCYLYIWSLIDKVLFLILQRKPSSRKDKIQSKLKWFVLGFMTDNRSDDPEMGQSLGFNFLSHIIILFLKLVLVATKFQ